MLCIEETPRHVSLADLEPDDCRYPFGDREITFCGLPKIHGSSYCLRHHLACWVQPIKRARAA